MNRSVSTTIESSDRSRTLTRPGIVNGNGRTLGRKQTFLILFAAIVLGVLAYLAVGYLSVAFSHESTDDAFIEGPIVPISPKVPGQVEAVHVVDNQEVKKGELLVELDPRDYEVKLAEKEAAVETARANQETVRKSFDLVSARVATAEASAKQAEAEADAARADAARAEAEWKRQQELNKQNVISPQELDNARANWEAARANLEAAREKVTSERSKVAEAQAQMAAARTVIEMSKSQIEQAATDVRAAQLDLSYTKIEAPRDGRVTRKRVEAGGYVEVGQTLFALVPDNVWVTANFKETQINEMRPGQPVEVEIEAYPNAKYHAHVDSIQAGSGARFSLLPPENAVGNFVKVVQRVPVKILFDEALDAKQVVGPGLSVVPTVRVNSFHIAWPFQLLAGLLAGAGGALLLRLVLVRRNQRASRNNGQA